MADDAKSHLKHEFLVGGISNMFFNGLIAWLLLRGGPALGWTGSGNFVGDLFATALLLPFIVGLIVIPLQRKKLNAGKLQPINLGANSFIQAVADRFPTSTLIRNCSLKLFRYRSFRAELLSSRLKEGRAS